ncbi:restriction endonuclease subunit S [Azonexus sp.]|uniref:restriction endonuclease subunit S n=1 Tax=Azonexus sp. TaxID=1872668 RepID=UPI0027B9FB7B|nr:restriction endonuclease subunit S [Azonexus sp.]
MDAQQFLAEFGHIANAPGGIERLRELVLHLAVTGKLVEQNATDECAKELLARMRQYASVGNPKKRGRASKKVNSKQLYADGDMPPNWVFVELGELGDWGAGSTPSRRNSSYYGGTIPWFKSGELKADYITSSEEFVSELALKECSLRLNIPGDVLIAMYGANIGQTSIVGVKSTTNQAVCACTPHNGLNNRFLLLTLRAMKNYFIGLGAGGAQPNISKEKIVATCIGLPPSEEQSRIVAKLDELMALCDTLEAQQQARRELQNKLRQSTLQAVANATSPHELQTTWARLADNFGRLFHGQDDVDDLRKAVLDLAVSGYLSNLDELDEPASVLKGKILAAKERGIADGSFFRKKHVKPEELVETTLPAHWASITLDEAISTIDAGWSPACLPSARDDENKWGVLKTTAVQVLRFLPHEHKELPASLDPRPQYQIEVGDILITRAGPKNRVGICCVVDAAPPRLMISDKLIRFHIVDDLINPRFVALCLSAGEPGRIVERLKSGMADSQMNISQDKLRSITIPLPPIEEQQRILTKIEAFMKVVDVYSERLRKSHRLAEQAAAATVSSLTGIAIEQEEEPMKAPQTELVAPLRLGAAPDIKAQAPLSTILARHHGEMSAKDLWQRFGGEIDAFYAQLKTEVAHGWILEPAPAEMREKPAETVSA